MHKHKNAPDRDIDAENTSSCDIANIVQWRGIGQLIVACQEFLRIQHQESQLWVCIVGSIEYSLIVP